MPSLPAYTLWGLGYPRLSQAQSEEQRSALRALPLRTRLLAGASLLGSLLAALALAIAVTAPGLSAFERWFGTTSKPNITGFPRVLLVACLMAAAGTVIAVVWCAITSVWVRHLIKHRLLSPQQAEAIARGRYFG
jgi:hypothetical protein